MEARDLAHLYDGARGLRALDLEVRAGECVALLGHNGSGKTTALLCIAGLLRPTAGSVRLGGLDPFVEPEAIRARMAMAFVSDSPVFYRDLTVAEHLELVGAAYGVIEQRGRVGWRESKHALIEEFGLSAHRDVLPHQLSSGLRQRTQLACTFARPFEVLVLDEPLLRLDPDGQDLLVRRLRRVASDGGSTLLTTHAPAFAKEVGDRLAILEDGVLVASGTLEQLAGETPASRVGLST